MSRLRARLGQLWTAGRPLRLALRRATRRAFLLLTIVAAIALVIAGVALIYPPAGVIAAGLVLFAFITFDPSAARRLIWPR